LALGLGLALALAFGFSSCVCEGLLCGDSELNLFLLFLLIVVIVIILLRFLGSQSHGVLVRELALAVMTLVELATLLGCRCRVTTTSSTCNISLR
jgi:hypothetical protein